VSGEVSWRRPSCCTADVTGVPSACAAPVPLFPAWGRTAELCADLLDTSSHCAAYPLYLFLLQDPRWAWATTLEQQYGS